MTGDVVIRAEGLGKKYVIGHQAEREGYVALRDVLARGARSLWRKTGDMLRGRAILAGDTVEEFWALKDVSFEVRRGEVLGIIGRNGAGKSTLLKILSRITEPSLGRVTIQGRVASLLEVGTGFHPELTGRENIYLNGAILGMTRAEIRKKFDEIVAFAEVEKFLDTPVKRYSSGMYVRLAFAVAAHLEPEILIVDEVLAVGDAEFQKKCLGKMGEVAGGGRTVLFVSHNLEAIKRLCGPGILLNDGMVREQGKIGRCLQTYTAGVNVAARRYVRSLAKEAVDWCIREAWLEQHGVPGNTLIASEPFDLVFKADGRIDERIAIEFIVRDQNKYPIIFCPSGLLFGKEFKLDAGNYLVRATIRLPRIAAGRYYLDVILAKSGAYFFDYVECALFFDVAPDTLFGTGWVFTQQGEQGAITLSCDECEFRCEPDSEPLNLLKTDVPLSIS